MRCACRITSQFLGDRCLVSLDHNFAKNLGVLIVPGQHKDQLRPQFRKAAEPVQNVRGKDLRVDQCCGCTMQLVAAPLHIAKPIGRSDRAVPGVPGLSVFKFDM